MKKPNVPMNHAITTCRHKVDKKKFEEGWERIWGDKTKDHAIPTPDDAVELLAAKMTDAEDERIVRELFEELEK